MCIVYRLLNAFWFGKILSPASLYVSHPGSLLYCHHLYHIFYNKCTFCRCSVHIIEAWFYIRGNNFWIKFLATQNCLQCIISCLKTLTYQMCNVKAVLHSYYICNVSKYIFHHYHQNILVVLKTRTFRLATKLRQKFNRFSPFRKLTSFVTSFTAVIYAPNTDFRIFQLYKYLGAAKYV